MTEAVDVEPQLLGATEEVVILQLVLTLEEEIVHLPETTLGAGRLCRPSSAFGEGMHVVAREVAKHEAEFPRRFFQEPLDHVVGAAAVWAFELPILDERYRGGLSASKVIVLGDRLKKGCRLVGDSHLIGEPASRSIHSRPISRSCRRVVRPSYDASLRIRCTGSQNRRGAIR